MKFLTNNTERFRVDAGGNVGISNSIPSSFNAGANNLVVGSGSGSEGITIYGGGESNIFFADGTAGSAAYIGRIEYSHSVNKMLFYVNNSNAMTIDSAGDTFYGITSKSDVPTYGGVYIAGDNAVGSTNSYAQVFVSHNSNTNHGIILKELNASGQAIQFLNSSATLIGSIATGSSSTAYNTSSDYRLKQNVVAMSGSTERLKQLKPSRFNFIADADATVDGFLAHEVQNIVPEAITGAKDAVDADGNPQYQGIDQSKLVPLLVATIQELEARITALES